MATTQKKVILQLEDGTTASDVFTITTETDVGNNTPLFSFLTVEKKVNGHQGDLYIYGTTHPQFIQCDNTVDSGQDMNCGQNLTVGGYCVVDNNNKNNGSLSPGINFGGSSGEGIASRRTAGENQYGLDFYTNFTRRMSIDNQGNIKVPGDIELTNGDCAEEFDISSTEIAEPGTVMVLNEAGSLEQSYQAYDKKVAGIVPGAGNYKPGIVLDKQDISSNTRVPISLMGKVYCKVDATGSPIEVGDLLTTSQTKGHAMKAEDPFKAFGTVIGKALGSIKEGLGMIPVLVALQ